MNRLVNRIFPQPGGSIKNLGCRPGHSLCYEQTNQLRANAGKDGGSRSEKIRYTTTYAMSPPPAFGLYQGVEKLVHSLLRRFSHLGREGVEAVKGLRIDIQFCLVASCLPAGGHEKGVVEKAIASADAE